MRLCALCHARRKTALSSKKMVTMEKQIRTLRHICWNLSMKNKHGPATAALGSYNFVDLAVYGKKVVRASSHSTLTYPCRVPLREAASFMDVCKQIVQKGNLQTDNRSIKCNNRLEKFHSNTLLLSSRQQLLSSFVKPLVVPARHLNTTTLGSELSSNSCYRRNDRNISLSAQCRRSAANLVFQRNPVDELQQYVSVSLIPDSHQTFSPNDKEIQEARQLFVKTDCHNIQRVKTARSEDQWPDLSAPEVLLLGRSNVGKSSLLKAFFKGAPQAISKISISKQPGHTKKLHFFDVGEKFTLIDAPGYGYNMPVHYQQSVEAYLRGRRNLCRSFVLIDSEIGLQKADYIGLDMMEEYKQPYILVLTKVDKAAKSKLVKNLLSVVEYRDKHTVCCLPQPFLVSSHTGAGIPLLQTFIAYITGSVKVTDR